MRRKDRDQDWTAEFTNMEAAGDPDESSFYRVWG